MLVSLVLIYGQHVAPDCDIKVDSVSKSKSGRTFMSSNRWFWILEEGEVPRRNNGKNITKLCFNFESVDQSMWIDFRYYDSEDECLDASKEKLGRMLLVLKVGKGVRCISLQSSFLAFTCRKQTKAYSCLA